MCVCVCVCVCLKLMVKSVAFYSPPSFVSSSVFFLLHFRFFISTIHFVLCVCVFFFFFLYNSRQFFVREKEKEGPQT